MLNECIYVTGGDKKIKKNENLIDEQRNPDYAKYSTTRNRHPTVTKQDLEDRIYVSEIRSFLWIEFKFNSSENVTQESESTAEWRKVYYIS